jgi:hypothetical protein
VPDRSTVILVCVLAVSFGTLEQASARTFGGYDCTDDCVSMLLDIDGPRSVGSKT